MYLWIGCKLPEDFQQEIRAHCGRLNEKIGLDTAAFFLPQHISLKISFPTDRAEEILADLEAYLIRQAPFTVQITGLQQMGSILWLCTAENETLTRLHRELDERLESRFKIAQHEFDKAFQFHSTLFLDADAERIRQMHRALRDYPFARTLPVDTFLLGLSETGKPGTYRVVKQINV